MDFLLLKTLEGQSVWEMVAVASDYFLLYPHRPMLLPFLALVTCLSTCHRVIKMGDPYLKIIVIAVVV